MKSFFVFFVTSISTAFITYLFQVFLALKLGTKEFSNFTLYWSYFGLTSIFGSFAQYWSTLNDIDPARLRLYRILIHSFSFLLLIFSMYFEISSLLIISLAIENIALSFIIGRSIRENDFKSVNIFNISLSCLKILFLSILPIHFLNTNGILYVILISFLLVEILFFNFQSKKHISTNSSVVDGKSWSFSGPFLFSILACTLPQIDILWGNNFKSVDSLSIMSELSFITKALFFLQMIIAQWLFPRQIKEDQFSSVNLLKYLILYLILLIIGAFLFSTFLPLFITKLLSWKVVPTQSECFWAGINAGMMSLFFQVSQDNIIRKKIRTSYLSFGFLIASIAFAGFLKVSIVQYFQISAFTSSLIFIFYSFQVLTNKKLN